MFRIGIFFIIVLLNTLSCSSNLTVSQENPDASFRRDGMHTDMGKDENQDVRQQADQTHSEYDMADLAFDTNRIDMNLPAPELPPRLLITTDIGGDPDDQQSLVRLLVYSNEFQIEGLIATAAGIPGQLDKAITRPDLIRKHIETYRKVYPKLILHSDTFPTADTLLGIVKNGNKHRGKLFIGDGHDTEGSNWIIEVVDREDPRPVDIAIWGGQTDLAQALFRVKKDRSVAEYTRFLSKIRVHDIADQDMLFDWIQSEFAGLWYILDRVQSGNTCASVFRGIFKDGDISLVNRAWMQKNVKEGHGPLGAIYPLEGLWTCGNGVNAMKEGDTPSWFYFLHHGLNDPAHPEWGSWGGRFQREGDAFRDAKDTVDGHSRRTATIYRWRPFFQNDFAARMDWCMNDFAHANHRPVASLNSDTTTHVLHMEALPGDTITLDASLSSDPDGDALTYKFWMYEEAGSFSGTLTLDESNGSASFKVPASAAGKTLHIVMEVTDSGTPKLTSLRRAVIAVQ